MRDARGDGEHPRLLRPKARPSVPGLLDLLSPVLRELRRLRCLAPGVQEGLRQISGEVSD